MIGFMNVSQPPVVVWFRLDLRLADNPALSAALATGAPMIPLFIWSPDEEGAWPPGGASKWWLHKSLAALSAKLRQLGSRLILRQGPSLETLRDILRSTGARTVLWNRRYEPEVRARDSRIEDALRDAGVKAESFNAALLREPWTIQNRSGRPFQVFTPFWRHCLSLSEPPVPTGAPCGIPAPARWPVSLPLERLQLAPVPDWASGLNSNWTPGEAGAQAELNRFLATALANYAIGRNHPGARGTSRLSPHLHFGEISPRQIWQALRSVGEAAARVRCGTASGRSSPSSPARLKGGQGAEPVDAWRQSQFLTELGWREFAHHLVYHFPQTTSEPLRPEFSRFRWRKDPALLAAWQRGLTGYPFVDAGMRELWTTGWMHNRVRMVVASFLVKDLLISWTEGARWFWDTLVDADLAQNILGWQWTAGCGADAAPFFRVFNPVAQGERFDPQGTYVRRWVPELAAVPDAWIHQPFAAPAKVLAAAGVPLGHRYRQPVVNHSIAREIALEAYSRLRGSGSKPTRAGAKF